jgi:hypothetical protein
MSLLAIDQATAIEYHRTTGWTIIRSKIAPVIFARRESSRHTGGVELKAWRGTSGKTLWYYSFRTVARAEQEALALIESCRSSQQRRAEAKAEKQARRAALKASDHWQVGDCVYTSWGYDQTNVEYYQITAVKARSVIVRQIAANSSDQGQPGGGKIAPRRFEYIGPEIYCPLSESGRFSAGPCYDKDKPIFRHACYKWDGRARYTSSDR